MRAGTYALLVVADRGPGIDEEAREHIFEPFYTTKPEGRGSGLGLASCYGIANRAGGFITLETAPGRGSTFTVHLPARAGAAAP